MENKVIETIAIKAFNELNDKYNLELISADAAAFIEDLYLIFKHGLKDYIQNEPDLNENFKDRLLACICGSITETVANVKREFSFSEFDDVLCVLLKYLT